MTIVALDLETFMQLTAPPPERPIMTNQQAPEIYTLHTVLNEGERPWSGIYGVRADAEHDAKVMCDVTGRHWSVVRLVVADTAAPQPSPTPQADSQPAVQQGDATRAAARALSDRVAEMCNVDKEDHWKYHSDDVLSDAELVISTYLAARAPADSVLEDAAPDIDAAFEAVRRGLCNIPRYSFALDSRGNLRRCEDKSGNWIEFDAAHALFDPVAVDAARKQGGAT